MTDAAKRLELINRLNELEAAKSSEQVMTAFRSSLNQIESVLGDQAKDVSAVTGKIDEVKQSVDKFKDVVEHAKSLLETNGLDGVIDGAKRTSDAYGQISDGVGKLGSKSKEVADTIAKLSDKLDKIAELQAMGGDQADKLISEFGNMISGITDLLGPLIDAVPVIGPFLDMYVQAIEGISKSVTSIIGSMRSHNLIARQAGLDDVYKFTVSGATARQREIDEITAQLDEMGWYDPADTAPAEPTAEERRAAIDAHNAFLNGLTACGCGAGAASPEAGWREANRRLHRARQRLSLAGQRASDVEWMGRDFERLQRESDEANAKLDAARQQAAAAAERVAAESKAGHSSGSEISSALDAEKAADAALTQAETAATRAAEPLNRYESARKDLEGAKAEYDQAYGVVKACFDKMYAALPGGDYFDASRAALTSAYSPAGWFEANRAPALAELSGRLKPIPSKPVKKQVAKKSAAKKSGSGRYVAKRSVATQVGESGTGDDSRKRTGLLVMSGLVVVVLVIVLIFVFTGGGDNQDALQVAGNDPALSVATTVQVALPPTPSVEVTTTIGEPATTTEAPTTTTTVPEPTLTDLLPPQLVSLGEVLQLAGMTNDEIVAVLSAALADGRLDFMYSRSDTVPGNGGPDIDLIHNDGFETSANDAQRNALFANTIFPCGAGPEGMITACDGYFEPGTIGPDGIVVLVTAFDAPVAGESWRYVYSAVFDSDGDPANNFQASGSFDWDQYQNTDRWWVLDVFEGVPQLGRFDGSFGASTQTGARVVIADNAIVWFIPRIELGSDPTWRATSFRHDGSYDPAVSAGDVSGANPTEPLLPIAPLQVTLAEEG